MAPKGLLKQDEMQIFIIYKEARLFQKKNWIVYPVSSAVCETMFYAIAC